MKVWIVVEEWWNGSRYNTDPSEDISVFFEEKDARRYADEKEELAVKYGDVLIHVQEKTVE